MKITPLSIEGAWLIESSVHGDDRGYFIEWFKKSRLAETTGIEFRPVQANISKSQKNVVRGIHYSIAPQGQGKVITVANGSVIDFVIDIREGSPTFLRYETIHLVAGEGKSIFLSSNLAHAFLSLENETIVSYLVSAEYDPQTEKSVMPFCAKLKIDWKTDRESLIISDRDRNSPDLEFMMSQGLIPKLTS